jgi:hypothetical protein
MIDQNNTNNNANHYYEMGKKLALTDGSIHLINILPDGWHKESAYLGYQSIQRLEETENNRF